ncbi:uncharacterized protein LOC131021600 [Salvia miltiorrhiza]|uniref:uncharacterized protein LOC131021600 n=1 Tax=Salvia miltiorrhiza TaxID=226208 RepID=UPI0025AC37FB|nr:uncharacterized protein LOC131021600 [Salvia miltiorrhiza]
MVSRVEEAMKVQGAVKGKESYQQQLQKQIVQCNKGKITKFKRSTSNLEEDGLSAAIFLLACVACTPSN